MGRALRRGLQRRRFRSVPLEPGFARRPRRAGVRARSNVRPRRQRVQARGRQRVRARGLASFRRHLALSDACRSTRVCGRSTRNIAVEPTSRFHIRRSAQYLLATPNGALLSCFARRLPELAAVFRPVGDANLLAFGELVTRLRHPERDEVPKIGSLHPVGVQSRALRCVSPVHDRVRF
jgi:hypothetical protein